MSRPSELSPKSLRPEVQGFEPYVAGLSIEEIKARYNLSQVIKLASNENPLGASPLTVKALKDHAPFAFRYPQSGNPELVRAISDQAGVPAEKVVVGNGSDEIIDLLIRAAARPGKDNILAFSPCFSMYKILSRLCGVELRQTPLDPETLRFPWDDFLALADENTALAFVTSPDNPSGYAPPVKELETLARALPKGCVLVIDEAYIDFCGDLEAYSLVNRLDQFPNVVLIRTFSKMFGLAGLRLGYAVAPTWLSDYLWRIRPPFSVNVMAQAGGIAALGDKNFQRATLETVTNGRDYLTSELSNLGCRVWPSRANFILFGPPADCKTGARDLFEKLLAKGIIIRTLGSYSMPDLLRVSVGTEPENKTFIAGLREAIRDE